MPGLFLQRTRSNPVTVCVLHLSSRILDYEKENPLVDYRWWISSTAPAHHCWP